MPIDNNTEALQDWLESLTEEQLYCAWYAYHCKYLVSKGGRASTADRIALSRRAKETSDQRWRVRRARYGPSGRKLVDKRLKHRLEGGEVAGWKPKKPVNDTESDKKP